MEERRKRHPCLTAHSRSVGVLPFHYVPGSGRAVQVDSRSPCSTSQNLQSSHTGSPGIPAVGSGPSQLTCMSTETKRGR